MKFRVNQNVASPLKITVRDDHGNLVDLAGYTSATVDVIDPYGTIRSSMLLSLEVWFRYIFRR